MASALSYKNRNSAVNAAIEHTQKTGEMTVLLSEGGLFTWTTFKTWNEAWNDNIRSLYKFECEIRMAG